MLLLLRQVSRLLEAGGGSRALVGGGGRGCDDVGGVVPTEESEDQDGQPARSPDRALRLCGLQPGHGQCRRLPGEPAFDVAAKRDKSEINQMSTRNDFDKYM